MKMRGTARVMVAALAMALAAAAQTVQPSPPDPASMDPAQMDLVQAVTTAWAHFPGMAAAQQAAAQAAAQAQLAATALLPNAGVAGQWDRGTDNAVLGPLFASPLPGISGTVPVGDYSGRSAWTSAAGLYFSWEIADFGRRDANIRFFRELGQEASDQAALVRLQVGAHAADAYLNVLAAQEQVRVTAADVTRWQGLAAVVDTLVGQQLRPGADSSRAQAELAAARLRAGAASRNLALAEATLAEALGLGAGRPAPQVAPLDASGLPPAPAAPAGTAPQLKMQADAVAAAEAHQREIARAALPRWTVLASAYGRGTGVLAAGHLAPGATGLAPTTAGNWAAGLSLDFSITRWRANQAQRAEAKAALGAQQARQRQVEQALGAARARAAADWEAARTAAQLTPVGLEAARTGEAQARVRYQSGLASLVEVANAEQLLMQADSDNALSTLQLWRALVENAFAAGDLAPVLAAAGGH